MIFNTVMSWHKKEYHLLISKYYCKLFSKDDIQHCDELAQKGIKIQFKLIPDEQGLSWETVKNNLKKGE